MRRELTLVEVAPSRVARLPDRAIGRQAAAFLIAGRDSARDGHLALRLLGAERPLLAVERRGAGFRGRVLPPDPAAADALRSDLSAADVTARASSEFTYGWRTPVAFEIPPYAVPGNSMDDFVDRARELDAGWLPQAGAAASGVTLTLDGKPVDAGPLGRFRLAPRACGGMLRATDGAGGTTQIAAPGCRVAAQPSG